MAILKKNSLMLEKRLEELGIKSEELKPIKIKKKKDKAPVSVAFANELSSAGIRMRTNEFLILWVVCAAVLPSFLYIAGMHPVSVIAAAAAGLSIPLVLVNKRKKKRLILFEHQLGDSLLLIGNCLRAGMTFHQAMSNVATEMPDPIAKEFSRTVKEMQLGTSVDVALDRLVQRVKSTDLMITVSAVQIQREVGGNLLEILESIAETIRDRIKIKNDIRVISTTGRSSGAIIGILPLAIGGMLMLINPAYIMTFFETKMGITMLIAAAVMEITGFLFINKIVNIKY
jgi:tight adherence protein B